MIDAVTILAAVIAALLATVILTLGFLRRPFMVRRRQCPYCGEVTEDCRLSVRRRPRAGPAKKSLEHEAEVHHGICQIHPWHFSALTTQATVSLILILSDINMPGMSGLELFAPGEGGAT